MTESNGSPFPPRTYRDSDAALDDSPPLRLGATAGTVTRRAITAAGLAGVTLLAACQTLPVPRTIRRVLSPTTPTPSATPSVTPTPSVSVPATLPTVTLPPLDTVTPTTAPSTTASSTTPSSTASTAATTTATTAASSSTTPSSTSTAPSTTPTTAPAPAPVSALPVTDLIARRATFGPTLALVQSINALGVQAWLDQQLAPASVPDPAGDAVLAAWPAYTRPYPELEAALGDETWRIPKQVQARSLARAAWSSRQVLEVMTQFWANHFNINVYSEEFAETTFPDFENNVLRRYALGTFSDLLTATAAHPAMMTFLNLAWSNKGNPNENYARELLELHTVGVTGGYTETDVKELAKLLTGWRVDGDRNGYTPYFEPNAHHVGPITVMGRTFANPSANGQAILAEVTGYFARRPETARYLSLKLARHFVSDEPPAALVDRMAAAYLAADTAIAPVLRTLFLSPEFAASSGAKIRRPYERFVATLRLIAPQRPANIEDGANRLIDKLPAQSPHEWPTPDGYPDFAAAWLSAGTALDLFNVGADFLRGIPSEGGVLGVRQILTANPTTFDAVATAAAQIILLRDPTAQERAAVVALLAATRLTQPLAANSTQQRQASEFAAALLLASPAHLTR